VTNIHRIADAVRGAIIPPGETFSLNGHVGQRTKEKGYVEAPVIYDGTHDTDVGGGVSQFATTTFNAAFFGGLDIPAYQMHSQFISRYPYGREATVSWDKPDLKIRNNTPFGVMIWTSYTDTSLTVSMYSTPWVKGDQTNQSREQKGPCTSVTTERTRTFFLDNRTEVDKFHALYQPADGVKC
jgi:vancomycin resistance protein YoaR